MMIDSACQLESWSNITLGVSSRASLDEIKAQIYTILSKGLMSSLMWVGLTQSAKDQSKTVRRNLGPTGLLDLRHQRSALSLQWHYWQPRASGPSLQMSAHPP